MNTLSNELIKHVLLTKQPPYRLLCKGTLTCTTSTNSEVKILSPHIEKILKKFGDVFPSEDRIELPPF